MQKINGPGATVDNEWTEGDPSLAIPRTTATAAWLNSVQRELIAVVEAAGLSPSTVDDDQILEAIRGMAGGSGRRNQVVNGDFQLNQRGGNLAATGYGPDRWFKDRGDNATSPLWDSVALAFGQTDIPDNPTHNGIWNQLSGLGTTSTPGYIEQRLEGVRTFQAQSAVTLSFWGKVQTGTLSVTPKLVQDFDGGSTNVTLSAGPAVFTTTWQKFAFTFNVATVAGKTIGGVDNYLAVRLEWPHVATFLAEVAEVQLELGDGSTRFERLTVQQQFVLASRYYQKSHALGTDPDTATTVGAIVGAGGVPADLATMARRLLPMLKVPTVAWRNTDGTADEIEWGGARVVSGTSYTSDQSTGYPATTTQPGGTFLAEAHFTADAEIY